MVAEEGEEGPGKCEHRDDEEDQDGVGSESVLVDETINEPGEHAHTGDLRYCQRCTLEIGAE